MKRTLYVLFTFWLAISIVSAQDRRPSGETYTIKKYMKDPGVVTGSIKIEDKYYDFNGTKYKFDSVVYIINDSDTLYYNDSLHQMEKTNIQNLDLRSATSLESIAKSLRIISGIQIGLLIAGIILAI
jgi:hypothetical protein